MRDYLYRCNDYSLLTPAFKKWFVAPLLPYTPWVLPANFVTLISNAFVYIGLFIALYYDGPVSRLIIAACLFLYLVGDHLDGMQAKRTRTGSALGEFCDHYLDAFNNGIILFTAFLVFDVNNPWIIIFTLITSYLAHLSVFYEQFKTGWLTFEKIGSLEAVLLTSILIGSAFFDQIWIWMTAEITYSLRLIDVIFILSAFGALNTFITTLNRTPSKGIEVLIFVLAFLAVGWFTLISFDPLKIFVLITLYGSFYVGQVMRGHLIDGVERVPDLVVPVALSILSLSSSISVESTFWILSSYLFVRIAILVIQTFSALKVFWVWSNPRI